MEHLVAVVNGGTNNDENCVVCCRTVNLALGNLPIKVKLQALLNQAPIFQCPARTKVVGTKPLPEQTDSTNERLALVVADLQKRGAARPRKVATLKNTINSMFQKQLTEQELNALIVCLESSGLIAVLQDKVAYSLPSSS